MSKRKIHLTSENSYDLKTNNEFSNDWKGLKDKTTQEMIAQQLTYLDFLSWLHGNLKYEDDHGKSHSLWLHQREGFYKTLVVSYASIAELALFSIINTYHRKNTSNSPKEIRDCFEVLEHHYLEFSSNTITTDLDKLRQVETKLYGRITTTKKVDEREITFDKLIKAGKSIKLYDDNFCDKLNTLRDLRNGVHLKKHISLKDKNTTVYTIAHVKAAKEIIDELREKISSFAI